MLLVRHGDAEATKIERLEVEQRVHACLEVLPLGRHGQRHVAAVETDRAEARVVQMRTERVLDGPAHHAEHARARRDRVEAVQLAQLRHRGLPGRRARVALRARVGEKRAELRAEHARCHAMRAHAQRHRGLGCLLQQLERLDAVAHAARLPRQLGHGACGVVPHGGGSTREIAGAAVEIVAAEHQAGLQVAHLPRVIDGQQHLLPDVGAARKVRQLEVDVARARIGGADRLEHAHAIGVLAAEVAAFAGASDGHDAGRRAFAHQPQDVLQAVRLLGQRVHAPLHQSRSRGHFLRGHLDRRRNLAGALHRNRHGDQRAGGWGARGVGMIAGGHGGSVDGAARS